MGNSTKSITIVSNNINTFMHSAHALHTLTHMRTHISIPISNALKYYSNFIPTEIGLALPLSYSVFRYCCFFGLSFEIIQIHVYFKMIRHKGPSVFHSTPVLPMLMPSFLIAICWLAKPSEKCETMERFRHKHSENIVLLKYETFMKYERRHGLPRRMTLCNDRYRCLSKNIINFENDFSLNPLSLRFELYDERFAHFSYDFRPIILKSFEPF